VWLREDVQQEEWVQFLKAPKKKGQPSVSSYVSEALSSLAQQTNEFTVEKVLKTNNQKVRIFLKN